MIDDNEEWKTKFFKAQEENEKINLRLQLQIEELNEKRLQLINVVKFVHKCSRDALMIPAAQVKFGREERDKALCT